MDSTSRLSRDLALLMVPSLSDCTAPSAAIAEMMQDAENHCGAAEEGSQSAQELETDGRKIGHGRRDHYWQSRLQLTTSASFPQARLAAKSLIENIRPALLPQKPLNNRAFGPSRGSHVRIEAAR